MSKISYLMILLVAWSIVACDNDVPASQVPSIVRNTFKNRFSKATDVEWKFIKNAYEVSFEMNNVDHDALLDSSGNLVKYKYEIDKTRIPNSIKSFMAQEYPKEKWEDPEHIKSGNSDYFQLELDGFFNDKKLVLDSMGKIVPNITYWN